MKCQLSNGLVCQTTCTNKTEQLLSHAVHQNRKGSTVNTNKHPAVEKRPNACLFESHVYVNPERAKTTFSLSDDDTDVVTQRHPPPQAPYSQAMQQEATENPGNKQQELPGLTSGRELTVCTPASIVGDFLCISGGVGPRKPTRPRTANEFIQKFYSIQMNGEFSVRESFIFKFSTLSCCENQQE